jgi:hypothetical protein
MYIRHFPDLERFFMVRGRVLRPRACESLTQFNLQATVAGVINDRLKARGVR